jgi:hypothetical protein
MERNHCGTLRVDRVPNMQRIHSAGDETFKLKEHHRTSRALLASDTGDKKDAKWFPLSQIEIVEDGKGFINVTIPEWLAKQNGLI